MCHEALREFILETRDFAKLLGDIRGDGTRIKGVIEERLELIKFIDQDDFLKTITMQAAAVADDKGLTTDAVLLYHLAEDYDKVIQILNRTLSDAVSVDLGASSLKLQPLKPRMTQHEQQEQTASTIEPGSSLSLITVDDPAMLAKNMIGLYNSNALYYEKINLMNRESCGVLLRMMDAKKAIQEGNWTQGLDVSSSPSQHAHSGLTNMPAHQPPQHPPSANPRLRKRDPLHRTGLLRPAARHLAQRRSPDHVDDYVHRARA